MKLIIIVIALVVALVVAYGVSTFVNEKKAEPTAVIVPTPTTMAVQAQPQTTDIYVAQHDLPIGTVIGPADYDVKHWSQNILPPGAISYGKDTPKIDGMITRTSVNKDSPLLTSQLRNPNDPTYIAGQLGEGMRAITVPVNLTSSVAGFVSPGDKVDVLFTFELVKNAVEGGDVTGLKGSGNDRNLNFTEVLLPNVRVLAVDTRVTAEQGPPQKDGQQQNGNQPPPIPSSVTLEVNQRDAQKLKLAQKSGDLTLVLRSVKDKDNNDIVRPTAEQDLTRILPPAYFPVLYDNNSNYDFSVVDLYGQTLGVDKNCAAMTLDKTTGKMVKKCGQNAVAQTKVGDSANPQMSVNIYRGVQLEKVEVNKP